MISIPNLLISSNRSVHCTTNGFLWGLSRYSSFNKKIVILLEICFNKNPTKYTKTDRKTTTCDSLSVWVSIYPRPNLLRNPSNSAPRAAWTKPISRHLSWWLVPKNWRWNLEVSEEKVHVPKKRKGTEIGMFFFGRMFLFHLKEFPKRSCSKNTILRWSLKRWVPCQKPGANFRPLHFHIERLPKKSNHIIFFDPLWIRYFGTGWYQTGTVRKLRSFYPFETNSYACNLGNLW